MSTSSTTAHSSVEINNTLGVTVTQSLLTQHLQVLQISDTRDTGMTGQKTPLMDSQSCMLPSHQ